ncbi:MAG: serine--tRNA ligase [Candidatus Schekmanbacteria bacterium RIFCSPHIGHO2_02_FULL_38_11]|nr:MAG: serine--tRNA ligase [Candidatus Schekmanbacteria bacterium RIFCSPHIGHO2_02_FULL_38_11]
MLDLKYLRENFDSGKREIEKRGNCPALDEFIKVDHQRRTILQEVEGLKFIRNKTSDFIGKLKKEGQNAEEHIKGMKDVSDKIKRMDDELKLIEEKENNLLLNIPNIPHQSVPFGKSSDENTEIRKWGEKPVFKFKPKDHQEIGTNLEILDFERSAKISGSRFCLYRKSGALLERALMNFMLDLHTKENNYIEVLPPFLVNPDSMRGTGQLPKFEEDLFKIEGGNYYLIPTAEVPVTNIHRNEILREEELPLYYTAFTPCFRREAGTYGKETKGLIRQHQFNKVELVKIVKPEGSYDELERLTNDAEKVLQRLNLHYRVISLCAGDLGFSSAKTYDIEVWLPSESKYVEISSCSNFEDFQARRAEIKYRKKDNNKVEFVHTLNGSGLAIGRTVVAIIENYQEEDGSVNIPETLISYMGGIKKISRQ